MIRIGTRGSALARAQTDTVAELLRRQGQQVDIIVMSTQGDRVLDKPLPEIGGKGVFTEELEAALRAADIDLAVHSLKDLPVDDASGLTVGAVLPREDPRDVLISKHGLALDRLPANACIGTSSLRRSAQLRALRPDFEVVSLRGNIQTRLRKGLEADGSYDAIILAAAGLLRMGLDQQITQFLEPQVMLSAPGQGAIAVQCRAHDAPTLQYLQALHHLPTSQAVIAERQFLGALGAGCRFPVAARAERTGDQLSLDGLIASLDGTRIIRRQLSGPAAEPAALGRALAADALAAGASEILQSLDFAGE